MNANPALLVLNAGSSSLKFLLREAESGRVLAQGLVENIDTPHRHPLLRLRLPERNFEKSGECGGGMGHAGALRAVIAALRDGVNGGFQRIAAIGHRVVHGGDRYSQAVRVDAEVLETIRACAVMAPLHNPASLTVIEACQTDFLDLPQVAVFDTAFHQTLPETAWRYAVPAAWHREFGVRRYGFQGISHGYVAARAAARMGLELTSVNLITLHLGSGASAAALLGGRCVDTSMGMTPLEGLIMGTRCGDLDASVPAYVAARAGLSPGEVVHQLNHASGLRGLCGDSDLRALLARRQAGDAEAALALEMYAYRVRKYIGAYLAVLGRVDALVFTAGAGERAPELRADICRGLEPLGLELDPALNLAARGVEAEIGQAGSRIRIWVIPTDEEGEIARQMQACLATS